MNIELRAVKYYASMSEETKCFEAWVYIDGVRSTRVSNRGTGGGNDYSDRAVANRLEAYAKTLPPTTYNNRGETISLPQSADSLVEDLLNDHLATAEYKRAIKKRVLFVSGGKLYQTANSPAAQIAAWLADPGIAAKLKAEKVLNLLPESEALAIFRAAK